MISSSFVRFAVCMSKKSMKKMVHFGGLRISWLVNFQLLVRVCWFVQIFLLKVPFFHLPQQFFRQFKEKSAIFKDFFPLLLFVTGSKKTLIFNKEKSQVLNPKIGLTTTQRFVFLKWHLFYLETSLEFLGRKIGRKSVKTLHVCGRGLTMWSCP